MFGPVLGEFMFRGVFEVRMAGLLERAFSSKTTDFLVHSEQNVVYLQIQFMKLPFRPCAGRDEYLDFLVWVSHVDATEIARGLYVFRFHHYF